MIMKRHWVKILSFADFANQQREKGASRGAAVRRLAVHLLGAGALLLLLSLLLLAIVRARFSEEELLLVSAGDGSLPAVCCRYRPGWLLCHTVVLGPGSRSSARGLHYALQQRGESRLRAVFVPVSAESLRGAEGLLQAMPAGALIFLGDSRQRMQQRELSRWAGSAGIWVQSCPSGRGSALGWSVDYRRGAGGVLDWQYSLPALGLSIRLQWAESGEMKLRWQKSGQAVREKSFPRSSAMLVWSSLE